jgi:hypothetical protein
MSTTTTTKFYMSIQLIKGGQWRGFGLGGFDTHKQAEANLIKAMSEQPDAHAFRITRETITTSFTAYQPITNPATT